MESITCTLNIDQNLSHCWSAVAMEAVQQNNSNGSDQTVAIPTTITASHISQIAQVLFMYVLLHTHFHDVYTYTCCVIEHLFKKNSNKIACFMLWLSCTKMSLGGNQVAVVQLPSGQFQVQGVIQSAQSSVIQSPPAQAQVMCRHAYSDLKLPDL